MLKQIDLDKFERNIKVFLNFMNIKIRNKTNSISKKNFFIIFSPTLFIISIKHSFILVYFQIEVILL